VEARRPAKLGRAHLRPAEAARVQARAHGASARCGVSVAVPDEDRRGLAWHWEDNADIAYSRALDVAAEQGILAPIVHELSVSAIVERWAGDDPRWEALIAAV
jgi:hypothetical protein